MLNLVLKFKGVVGGEKGRYKKNFLFKLLLEIICNVNGVVRIRGRGRIWRKNSFHG